MDTRGIEQLIGELRGTAQVSAGKPAAVDAHKDVGNCFTIDLPADDNGGEVDVQYVQHVLNVVGNGFSLHFLVVYLSAFKELVYQVPA